jgi:hypothetical protein
MKMDIDRTRRDEVKAKRRLKDLAWDKRGNVLFPFPMKHWSHILLNLSLSLSLYLFFKKKIVRN